MTNDIERQTRPPFQPTRLQRLPVIALVLLHVVSMLLGAGVFMILSVIVGMIFQIEDKSQGASLMLSFMLVGAFLPSVLLWRARRTPDAQGPRAPIQSSADTAALTAPTSGMSSLAKAGTVFAFIGILWIIFVVARSDWFAAAKKEFTVTGELPLCGSTTTTDMVKEIVRRAPSNKIINLEAYAVKEARERSWDPERQIRRCTATVYLNAGVDNLDFKIYWIDRSQGEFFIETE